MTDAPKWGLLRFGPRFDGAGNRSVVDYMLGKVGDARMAVANVVPVEELGKEKQGVAGGVESPRKAGR